MRPAHRILRRYGFLAAATAATLFVSAPALATAHGDASAARSVTAERWMRSVCRDVSTWLKTKGEVEARASETLGALAGGVSAETAKKRLTRAMTRGRGASDQLISSIKAAGTPTVAGGKELAAAHLKTLGSYRDAYDQARTELQRTKTTDSQQFTMQAQQINGSLVQRVGTDPVEPLRAAPELVSAISGYCLDVASYLAAKIDPPCRAALDTTQQLVDVENRYAAAPADSQDGLSLLLEEDRVTGQLRNQLTACTRAGLPGPCRKVFETAQRLVDIDQQIASDPNSPQAQPLSEEWARQFDGLRSDAAAVCR
jgi:hypothetical protein